LAKFAATPYKSLLKAQLAVRFAPKATELLRRREMTQRASSDIAAALFDDLVGAQEE
jgi:hypothetical protein